MRMMADVVQVSPRCLIQRERRLPIAGRVLVSAGDAVLPDQVVAEVDFPLGAMLLDLRGSLRVADADVSQCLVREIGEHVKAGDIIAQRIGKRITRLVRAPVDSQLVDVSRGYALLSLQGGQIQVLAGMPGFVEDTLSDMGVRLAVNGSLIQASWGNGKSGAGNLSLGGTGDERPKAFEAGQILAIRACSDEGVIKEAVVADVGGLIIGTLAAHLLPAAMAAPLPIVVLQGFEDQPVDPVCWEVLTDRIGDFCHINGQSMNVREETRPEVVIPCEGTINETMLGFRASLEAGRRVRVIGGKHMGETGFCIAWEKMRQFDRGIHSAAAIIKLAKGDVAPVPPSNLVIVG